MITCTTVGDERTGDVNAHSDKTGEYKEGPGGTGEAVPQTMTSTNCVQRMHGAVDRARERGHERDSTGPWPALQLWD